MFPTKLLFFLVVLSTQSFALPAGRQELSLDTPAVNPRDSDTQNSIGTIIKNKRDNEIDIEARAGMTTLPAKPAAQAKKAKGGKKKRGLEIEIEARARPGSIPRKAGEAVKKIFNGGKRDVENDLLTRGFGDFIDKIGKAPGAAKKFKDRNRNKNKREIFNAREPASVTVPYPQSQSDRHANADNKYPNRWRRNFAETGIALEARAVPGKFPSMGRKAGGEIKKIFGGGKRDVLEKDLTSRGVADFIDKVGQAPRKMARVKDAIRNRNKNKRGLEIEARAVGAKAGAGGAGGAKTSAGGAGGAKGSAGGAKNGAGGAGGAKNGAGGAGRAKGAAGGARGAKGGAGGAGGAMTGATGKAAGAAKKAGGGKKRDLEPEV